MAIDNYSLKIISQKLEALLVGAYFDNPMRIGQKSYAIPYHSANDPEFKGRGYLVISLEPSEPFLAISNTKLIKLPDNSPFFHGLTKMAGSKVKRVFKVPDERIIGIDVSIDSLDLPYSEATIMFELFPQLPNVVIIDSQTNKVISLYHEVGDLTSSRHLAKDFLYQLPSSTKRDLLPSDSKEVALAKLPKSLGRNLLLASNSHPLSELIEDIIASKELYVIDGAVMPSSFQFDYAKLINLNVLPTLFLGDQKEIASLESNKELKALIHHHLVYALKKYQNLIRDQKNALQKLNHQEMGEAIYTYQHEIKKGMTQFSKGDLSISLDPLLSASENAQKHFKIYKKAKIAIETCRHLASDAQEEILYLEKKELDVNSGNFRDVEELKKELILAKYLKEPVKQKKKKQVKVFPKCAPHFIKKESLLIGFGMNDLQNEYLTFNLAKADNEFFHIENNPGPHVLILSPHPSDEDRLLASEIALFLGGFESGNVQHTERRYVKKASERRGLVNLLKYESIYLTEIRSQTKETIKEALKK